MKVEQTRLFRRADRFVVGVRWNDGSEELHPKTWCSPAVAQSAADRVKREGMTGWRALL